ncbi:uncharacterized protein LOC133852700 [Alnus glutinosa]|uniref:uncharacterized protein LOC133852700 n=1 Tax=Alnus glutinosa TaxID=3517 RepID=UPI002D7773E5|nr:uncharacterized protein LOC133852700 [Alnus glutinosa]
MVSSSYVMNHDLSQPEVVDLLVVGFTGTLQSWWEKHLTDESRASIRSAVKTNEDGIPIFNGKVGLGDSDAGNTLFYTIVEHFIGTPSHLASRVHDQLSNLRCPTLSDFRWYKDVFLSRVMLRDDSNQPFWKKKFINCLTHLFAHKIKDVLVNENNVIDYDNLTYGNIISAIQKEGLKMCIDMKISNQTNKDKKKAKYEMGADLNCIQEGLVPTKYYNQDGLITYPMDENVKFKFLAKPELSQLNTFKSNSFSKSVNLIKSKTQQIGFLQEEIKVKRIEEQLSQKTLQQRIQLFEDKIKSEVCSDIPTAFWRRKKHTVSLPYIKDFDEGKITTKARPIQMSHEVTKLCRKEIEDLLHKGIIRKSKSHWSCSAFYVQKNAELERGAPRLVINYKPLNKVLEWIRYPIPNKRDLINRLSGSMIFSKFDMKSGF